MLSTLGIRIKLVWWLQRGLITKAEYQHHLRLIVGYSLLERL